MLQKSGISSFSCPNNYDVEYFIKNTAVEFEKQGLSVTYLVYAEYKKDIVLAGYFSLANKHFVAKSSGLSNSLKKRINKFGTYNSNLKSYIIPAPLIAQLSKNFFNGHNVLISGDELLKIAVDKVKEAQQILGGKFVYLECENSANLIHFYESNGFVSFGKRELDPDETGKIKGKHLIQMLRYLHWDKK